MKGKIEGCIENALALCKQHPDGLSQAQLQDGLGLTAEGCLQLVNTLLQKSLVDAHTLNGELRIKEKDQEQAVKLKNLTAEDILVYQAIKASQRQGIWSRDIKRQTNLAQTAVSKVLKTLESRNLVKSVKSVNDGKRKIYVLFDVEPATELTGGLWFQGNEMDLEFIQILQQQCKKFIAERGVASVSDIHDFIQRARILNVPLGSDTISDIVRTLHYDGVLEEVPGEDEEAWKIAGYGIPDETAFTSFPCGTCPVIGECVPGGHISPEKCEYFDQFLQF